MLSEKENNQAEEDNKLQDNIANKLANTLDEFLANSEQRAYRMAYIATNSKEEALDIVQDAMLTLVVKYAQRKNTEWPPLFYRIVQNTIRDWYRRQSVKNRFRQWFGDRHSSNDLEIDQNWESQVMSQASNLRENPTVEKNQNDRAMLQLMKELNQLPHRQQQAFLLRCWEGLDTKQTAEAMNISAGSVKTHYSRATKTLRKQLGDYYDA